MTSEAAETGAVANVASEGLTTFVEKRARELKGEKPAAAPAVAKAQTEPIDQAKEVKAEEAKPADESKSTPKRDDEGKFTKAAPDFDWASDKLKRRLTDLHAKGLLDEDAHADFKKDYLLSKGAYRKMEEAAEKVKAAEAERDSLKPDALSMRELLANEKRKAAYLKSLTEEKEAEAETLPADFDPLDPKQVKALAYAEARKAAKDEHDAREAEKAKAAEEKRARVKTLEGWADTHRTALGESVEDDAYEAALKSFLTSSLEDDPNLLSTLTEKAMRSGVKSTLEKMRLEAELKQLREQTNGSKRDAARAAEASSSPGIRASVEQAFDGKTLNGRVAATVASVGGREGWNRLRR